VTEVPETRYAKTSDGTYLAYQVVGSGPRDLVFFSEWWCCHVDYLWEEPAAARFLLRLASFSRLIIFDRRGMGASDRHALGPYEEDVADTLAVLDAVGSERAALFGIGGGGMIAAIFAATYPRRTDALIMHGAVAKTAHAGDYPWGWDRDLWNGIVESGRDAHGVESALPTLAPSVAGDSRANAWFLRMQRVACSPSGVAAILRRMWDSDTRSVLPVVQVPTLVLHPSASFLPVQASKDLASRIPNARWVEIAGDSLPFFGGSDAVLDEIQEFLTGERDHGDSNRVLATVMFTDIVGSTERAAGLGDRKWHEVLDDHDALVRRHLERFSGRLIKSTGDGLLATFDGPARAIRCGCALRDGLMELGIDIRVGLHTGEVELRGSDVGGMAVNIAARVEVRAHAGEVLVSRTVVDLVAGSGIEFEDRGEHELKGVPGTWRLYRVVS
jgi:class 3 adenylate cyclase/pimeloyl-ACP methyl ester carboxylesterase